MIRTIFALLVVFMMTVTAQAQSTPEAAVLVADNVFISPDRDLVAQGNVEAFQNGSRIRAKSITYNQQTGALTIEGPIVITDADGTIVLADAGEMSSDLREGLLMGARLVLDQQLQMAAVQINRVAGRYDQLYQAQVTSCRICNDGRPPLWQIRAKRVVHDRVEQQLYFDQAQLRILNIPVFYAPRLRFPGPNLDRSTGFLVPSIRTTSQLGTGIKIPYFIVLNDHSDLTVTPYISSATRTLELRYRRAFHNGRVEFNTAGTKDDQRPGELRGYLTGRGVFNLQRDFVLSFDIETVSDRSYFGEYEYVTKNRLTSQITVERARRDEHIRASLYNYESLRAGEVNDTLPTIVLDGAYERRYFPKAIKGELRFGLAFHAHQRTSDLDVDSADADLVVDGRDVARLHGRVDWLRRYTFNSGLVSDVQIGASFNAFDITQDATFDQNHADFVPHASVALRYPMVRQSQNGVSQFLEPLAQIGWVGGDRLAIPNDESTRVEFDQGNLLSLSRFPSLDRRERGVVGAVGLNWARFDPNGWDAHLTLGQVVRKDTDPDFSATSGLSGNASHFLIAGQIKNNKGATFTGRGLFDEDFEFAKAEIRGNWNFAKGGVGGSYIWMDADAAEERTQAVSEVLLNGNVKINKHWQARADWRFDVAADRAATAGFGLKYDNECVSVDLAVWRRYSSSTSVEPTTNFGFNVGLRGFAANTGTERHVRSCQN